MRSNNNTVRPESNLMNYGAGSYRRQSESLHRELYNLHYHVANKASDCLSRALMTLHTIEVDNADLRPVCVEYINELQQIRDMVDATWKRASALRSKWIDKNGCDGSCQRKSD